MSKNEIISQNEARSACKCINLSQTRSHRLDTTITIGYHNLHGFKKSTAYHRSCLQRHEGVWLGQEIWLTEKQFSTMSSLGTQYVARSAMEDAISSDILRGRQFSGVSIAWSPKLNAVIKPLTKFRHKRVVGVEIDSEDNKTLIINVYMPFFDSSKRRVYDRYNCHSRNND